MASGSVGAAAVRQEVSDRDAVRPDRGARVTRSRKALRDVIAAVVKGARLKKEAIAADMGIDRGQMYRQLGNGHLTIEDLETLEPALLATIADDMKEEYGRDLPTPRERLRELFKQQRAITEEIWQIVDGLVGVTE